MITDAGGGCDPTPRAPRAGELVINEILADPADGINGDANGSGLRDGSDDEFVEIGNISSSTLDLSGVFLSDAMSIRHLFAGTTLGCNKVVVVFGAGDTNHASWGANWIPSSTGRLSLNNPGDTVQVGTSTSTPGDLATAMYGNDANDDQSVVRATDLDPNASFVKHTIASGAALYSPGTRSNGASF